MHFEAPLWNPKTQHGASEDFLRHYTRLHMHVSVLYGMSAFGWGEKPRAQVLALIRHDRERVGSVMHQFNTRIRTAVESWNRTAYAQGLASLPVGSPVRFPPVPPVPRR
jgi:hypothetical protein